MLLCAIIDVILVFLMEMVLKGVDFKSTAVYGLVKVVYMLIAAAGLGNGIICVDLW